MNRKLLSVLLLVLLIFTNATSISVAKNQTFTVHNSGYNQLSMQGGSGKIKWSSSNKEIATVDSSGKVKGIKAGTCTIKAKRKNTTAECKIKVLSYYKGYKKIPDFGAIVGKCKSNVYFEDGISYVLYKAKNEKTAKNWVNTYIKKIKKTDYKETSKGSGVWTRGSYEKGYFVGIQRTGKTISIGYGKQYSMDAMFLDIWSFI